MKRRAVFSWLLMLGAGACSQVSDRSWIDEGEYRWRPLLAPGNGPTRFTSLSPSRTRVEFDNDVSADLLVQNRHLTNGSGVALADIDGDGWVDIYLGRLDGPNALYRNLGNWRFEDVTEQAGLLADDRFTTGVVFADVDGDRDLDLLVTALGGPNSLFLNDGAGVFTVRTRESGLESEQGSHTMALADVDGDGDLDLYVANYKVESVMDMFSPAERAFDRVVRQVGEQYTVLPEFREHYELRRDSDRILRQEVGEADFFYLNDGQGRFELVPADQERFLDEDGSPLTVPFRDWGLTARFHDVDGDGDPDLYVGNDFESPDRFWLNDGTGHFRLAPRLSLRSTSHSTMGVDFSDIDRDGDVDFLLTDMLSRNRRRRLTRTPLRAPGVDEIGVFDDRPQTQRNTLFLNRGDGTYAEIAQFAGIAASGWSWATMFMDVDLDGYEDALITNGSLFDALDSDAQLATAPDWREDILLFPTLPLRNAAFRNRGDLTFADVSEEWGFGVEEDVSLGMAASDLDGDGDLDLVLNRLGAPALVMRNEAGESRIAVRLAGMPPNTQGIGAKISVLAGAIPEQSKEVTSGGIYLSGSDAMYTFAAGDSDVLTITVDWPGGGRSVIRDAPPGREYEIVEPDFASAPAVASEIPLGEDEAEPYFIDATDELGHVHTELPFPDHERQPLLPNSFARLGPGVTWYDMDDDGDEDLLITSGRGGTLGFYRNEGGRFSRVPLSMPNTLLDQTTVLPLPVPGGGVSLLVGQANYEAQSPAAALGAASVLRVDATRDAYRSSVVDPQSAGAVGGISSTVGALALADYDGDGDLDLFVGGRILPALYPRPATSRLFVNDAGAFTLDSENLDVLAERGMVSAAVFSDVDGDGDPDLVLATEWGPVRVLRNDRGRFVDVTASLGLDGLTGRWNGVATGDLNGDGLMDIVATNWGQNGPLLASPTRPLRLYHGDFDRNGRLDLVLAQVDEQLGRLMPLVDFRQLAQAMPFLRLRYRTAENFAGSSIAEILGSTGAAPAVLEVTHLEHTLLLNRGSSFEAVPLPTTAQLAPSFFVGVADFDGDGNEDVFLTQNFLATVSPADQYNAGRGLWLQGDGAGGLRGLPAAASGIEVYGDSRGAGLADYDGDGRIDLAVSQNGAATRLFRNVGAVRGLRVRLAGPSLNPDAIGATIRMVYGTRRGPAREVQAGAGYWSHNSVVQVMGLSGEPTGVWVRWLDGHETETPVQPGTLEVTIGGSGEVLDTR